ncbi:helix-turn-helix domain-containing protein [Deinococcus oregonensis]|uniref:Helix-turn-helix domain-containing protein n=1 Tax=Deinococcus oregonensis TaxID=1805970 RepID=A0ABV6AYY6_9DEIO
MGSIRNALPEIMERQRIKQTALAAAAGLRYATVNALYNGKTERVDLDTLTDILDGLYALTGQIYTVADLLEYTPSADVTTSRVLAHQPNILERVSQLERGESILIPIEEVSAKYGITL